MKMEDYNEYYIQGSDHYLIPTDDFAELVEENKELKHWKELHSCSILAKQNIKLFNQQKEFIKYLEDMLDDENDIFSVVRVKDVLQKYKEIIGETNEN